MRSAVLVASMLFSILFTSSARGADTPKEKKVPTDVSVVLVHGLWADGSSWSKVIRQLHERGYTKVTAVQLQLNALADDIAQVKHAVAQQKGPTVLVGHSYGGAVITGAGTEPNVVALVYVAAYAPAVGETLDDLNKKFPPRSGPGHIRPDDQGRLWIEPQAFPAAFAADLDPAEGKVMAAVQKAPLASGLAYTFSAAGWDGKPSWYQVSENDEMIAPDLQRFMAKRINAKITSLKSSHASLRGQPKVVADLIVEASVAQNGGSKATKAPAR